MNLSLPAFHPEEKTMSMFTRTLLFAALFPAQSVLAGPPGPASMNAMFARTSAVVEATVTQIDRAFDPRLGPRHRAYLAAVVARLGRIDAADLRLDMYGGMLPDGRLASITEQPRLFNGGRYILFLTNATWFYSPDSADFLRVERVAAREVLVNDQGYAVTGVDEDGFHFGKTRLFDASEDEARPYELPRILPQVTLDDVVNALDRTSFLAALQRLAVQLRVAPSGEFVPRPAADHPWNLVPVSPARRSS